MNVLLERFPYRYVEKGTLENGRPDFRIQKMDNYSPRWKDMYLYVIIKLWKTLSIPNG